MYITFTNCTHFHSLKGQRMTSCACEHLCRPLREFYHISPSLVQLARSYVSWTSAPWPPSLPPRSPPIIPPNLTRAVIQHHTIALHQHILHMRKRSNQTRANLPHTRSRGNTASRGQYKEAGFQMLGRNQQPLPIVSNQMTDPRLLVMRLTVLQVVVGRVQINSL